MLPYTQCLRWNLPFCRCHLQRLYQTLPACMVLRPVKEKKHSNKATWRETIKRYTAKSAAMSIIKFLIESHWKYKRTLLLTTFTRTLRPVSSPFGCMLLIPLALLIKQTETHSRERFKRTDLTLPIERMSSRREAKNLSASPPLVTSGFPYMTAIYNK